MPGVFIGSTELTTVGDIKIGGTDVQEVYVGATKVFPGAVGPPTPIIDFDPVGGGGILGSSSFGRTTIGLYFDTTQYQQAAIGEARFQTLPSVPRHFLREPTATNNVLQSTNFADAGYWNSGGLQSIISDGVNSIGLTQHTLTADAALDFHQIFASGIQGQSPYYILKQGTLRFAIVRHGDQDTDYSCFDLQLGTVTENGSNCTGLIESIDNGYFKCAATSTSKNGFTTLSMSDTGTPGTAAYQFAASNETLLACHCQNEDTPYTTSPIVTAGTALTRAADSLTDINWPVQASAVVDVTVDNPIALAALGMTMLGFGSGAGRIFAVDAPQVLRLFNSGINSFTVPATSYEGERHSFGMSIKTNEGIVVDDESNNNTDPTGTPGQGTIYIGSDAILAGQPCKLHRVRIYDQTQSIEQLEALF